MENGPLEIFEDVFPLKNGDIPLLCLLIPEGHIFGFFPNIFFSANPRYVEKAVHLASHGKYRKKVT